MSGLRDTMLDALVRLRLLDLYQRLSGQTCTVLLYHSVSAGEGVPYYDVESFARQMDLLRDEFRVLSFDEWIWHREREQAPPPRSVLISFDDGFANNLHAVQPVMEQRQLPWLLFTTTQALHTPERPLWFAALRGIALFSPEDRLTLLGREWTLGTRVQRERSVREMEGHLREQDPERAAAAVDEAWQRVAQRVPESYHEAYCRLLTGDELRTLDASPLVEIGAHTRTHPFLTSLPAEQLRGEIDASMTDLHELLGHAPRSFAYPLGDYGAREVKHLREIGVPWAFAVQPRVDGSSNLEIPRTGIYAPEISIVRSKALGLSNALRSVGIASG